VRLKLKYVQMELKHVMQLEL